MPERVLHSIDDYTAALQAPRVLLFKHSSRCPISAAAREEYDAFRQDSPDVPTLFVDVIEDRATARAIADLSGVRHESPQAILFEQGRAVWNASHDRITRGSLHAAWAPRC